TELIRRSTSEPWEGSEPPAMGSSRRSRLAPARSLRNPMRVRGAILRKATVVSSTESRSGSPRGAARGRNVLDRSGGRAAAVVRQEANQAEARQEAAHVRHPRDARAGAEGELREEPEPEEDPGRHADDRPEEGDHDQGRDARAGVEHEVTAEDAGDRARGADHRGEGV